MEGWNVFSKIGRFFERGYPSMVMRLLVEFEKVEKFMKKDLGGIHKTSYANSQDFFLTLGLRILRLQRLKIVFEANINKS